MADIVKLRRRRATIKAKMTRLKSKAEQGLEDNVSREEMETYLSRLEEIRREFENVQDEINDTAEGELTDAEAFEETVFEERYLELKIKMKQWLKALPAQQGESRSSDEMLSSMLLQQGEIIRQMSQRGDGATANNGDAIERLFEQQTQLIRSIASGSGAANQETRVKLPVVRLPTFDGRVEDWKRFSETFQSMIHANESIPNIQKFQYLVTSLSGTAAKIIDAIELTDANYVIAWELLKKRFDDPRAIKKKHIQCLFTMPKVEKESAVAIRSLLDYTSKHLRVLKSLNLPTDSWNELVIHMMEAKLDATTLRAWEQSPTATDATLTNFNDFLERRCQTLERIEARNKEGVRKAETDKQKTKTGVREKHTALANIAEAGKCYLCHGDHLLYRCEKFLALSMDDRVKEVRRLKLCMNCLRHGHFAQACKMGSCRECSERHNTLCHRPAADGKAPEEGGKVEQTASAASDKTISSIGTHHVTRDPTRKLVLMATALVNATHPNGAIVPLRILLDSASEAHFITQAACNRLGVRRDKVFEMVTGINENESIVNQCCEVVIRSRCSDASAVVRGFVVPRITKHLPSVEINRDTLPIPSNVMLADPEFYKRGPIDMLIGAEFFFAWLEAERLELGANLPVLQNTKFGWIIAGFFARAPTALLIGRQDAIATLTCSLEHCEAFDQSIRKFWELESSGTNGITPRSEEVCESDEFFKETTTRSEDGRFIVRLPFNEDPAALGESREVARRRLMQLERRFKNDETLRTRYVEFMRDYLDMGHMSPVVDTEQAPACRVIYLPHHGVIKEASTSTKLRAVFDASSKTSSGKSLNDILRAGPVIQGSLLESIVRFRFYNVALTGDIRKMYRQVLVHQDDRDYQRILWRFDVDEPVQAFRLNTVTYGQASSTYLATRCIYELALEAQHKCPMASRALMEQTYVDDILTGARNIEDATLLQEQISKVLLTGGFETHKWCSNRAEALERVPPNLREVNAHLCIGNSNTTKTLGIEWNPHEDQFQFVVHGMKAARTKREMLSEIAKLFDPLGLIGPVLTTAKLIMQETWRIECQWDEQLPAAFVEKWEQFRRDMNATEYLTVPRRVIPYESADGVSLLGFCDASEKAYGACLYVQARNELGAFSVKLLCSRSRVAPLKPMSIPRLELCGAGLLANLIVNVQRNLNIPIEDVRAWTDSQVALWWIRGDVSRWKPFVANRVREIIKLLPAKHWSYVKGTDNPADIISRGTTPSRLKDLELWWSGPPWLQEDLMPRDESCQDVWPSGEMEAEIQAEARPSVLVCSSFVDENSTLQDLIDKTSSLTRIERVLAYCLRYASNLRGGGGNRNLSGLSTSELRAAHNLLIRYAQSVEFSDEIKELRKGRELQANSKILQLHPFLDDQGILRVGGRLHNSRESYCRRHQIILPAGTRISKLIFEREHRWLLHAGQQQLLFSVRERYWPLKGRDLARRTCHDCVRCARVQPRKLSQMMGSLPSDRVNPSRPFSVTGVDFAGPITTLVNKGRGRKTSKSYCALFVCFATRAIHLEAVSELSSAAFLATLRRFISRRGRPSKIYSDNATNFVGVDRELKEMRRFVQAQVEGNTGRALVEDGIEWKFIPPSSPHMGGLWEAGVRSCKHHLKCVMGNVLFTFEELSTVLTQVEACLNSRPLTPLSSDPADLQPLTPAHFLIGDSMTSIPDVDITDIQTNRLDRWRLVQRVLQDFWKRWAVEYVAGLQSRGKWKKKQSNLQIGDLVIIRDEILPPLRWKLGRVVELYPGRDSLVRVVMVRTANNCLSAL